MQLNSFNNTNTGVLYWGNCNAVYRLRTTFFNHHNIGLSIGIDDTNPSGLIGPQFEPQQNHWFEPAAMGGFQAANYDLNANGNSSAHLFRVYNSQYLKPEPTIPTNWITGITATPPSYPELCTEYPTHGLNDTIIWLLSDSSTFLQFDSEQRWMSKFYLYGDVSIIDSAHRATNLPLLDSFYHYEKSRSIGLYYSFIRDLREATQVDEHDIDSLAILRIESSQLLNQLQDSMASVISSLPDSSDFLPGVSILNSLTNNRLNIASIYENIDQSTKSQLSTALVNLSALPDTALIEYRLKYVLNSVLSYLLTDNLDSTINANTDLLNIAHLCPLEGGLATFYARDLLALPEITYEDEVHCALPSLLFMRPLSNDTEVTNQNIMAFPNPTSGSLAIRTHGAEGFQAGRVVLIDNMGRIVSSTINPEGQRTIELSLQSLTPGLYILLVQDAGLNNLHSQTIQVIR